MILLGIFQSNVGSEKMVSFVKKILFFQFHSHDLDLKQTVIIGILQV